MSAPKPCPVRDCPNYCTPERVMCKPHWFAVPRDIRDRVWNAYRDRPGSGVHLRAIMDAIASVSP